jgi:hypothetical protein
LNHPTKDIFLDASTMVLIGQKEKAHGDQKQNIGAVSSLFI